MENKVVFINSRIGLQDKSESTLNNANNGNAKLRLKVRSKNIKSKRKTYHSSSNRVDNNTLKPKFHILSNRYVSKNVKFSNYYNNFVNDTKKQEIMQMQTRSTPESINKKHYMTKNKVDHNTIEHDYCLYKLPL